MARAPTALVRAPEALADTAMADAAVSVPPAAEEQAPLVDMDAVQQPAEISQSDDTPITDLNGAPHFPPSKSIPLAFKREKRHVPVPPHRLSPLKTAWVRDISVAWKEQKC